MRTEIGFAKHVVVCGAVYANKRKTRLLFLLACGIMEMMMRHGDAWIAPHLRALARSAPLVETVVTQLVLRTLHAREQDLSSSRCAYPRQKPLWSPFCAASVKLECGAACANK